MAQSSNNSRRTFHPRRPRPMQPQKRLLCLFLILSSGIVRASSGQMTTLGIAAGSSHALALRSDGTVWAWGTNQLGELGISNLTESVFPARVSGLSNIVNIAAGSTNSLAVQTNGTVWAWGNNIGGQLGNGTSTNSPVPTQVTRITNAIAVSGGISHSLALLANGQVMSWGTNANFQ